MRGLGPKTISCVGLYCLATRDFPVDTHVFRFAIRFGWVPIYRFTVAAATVAAATTTSTAPTPAAATGRSPDGSHCDHAPDPAYATPDDATAYMEYVQVSLCSTCLHTEVGTLKQSGCAGNGRYRALPRLSPHHG